MKHNLNNKILQLWSKYFTGMQYIRSPLLYDDFQTNSLLFVGMNPSFSMKGFKSFLKGTKFEGIDPESFFSWQKLDSDPKHMEEILDLESCARESYDAYFGKLRSVAESVELPFEHLDLFLYRETSQKEFLKMLYKRGKHLNDFAVDQLDIFFEALELVQPKCIVVANAKASEIFQLVKADYIEWDEVAGHHWFTMSDRSVPIFFSSMLTGQRALDNGSFLRLQWHVAQVMK